MSLILLFLLPCVYFKFRFHKFSPINDNGFPDSFEFHVWFSTNPSMLLSRYCLQVYVRGGHFSEPFLNLDMCYKRYHLVYDLSIPVITQICVSDILISLLLVDVIDIQVLIPS